MPTIRLAGQQFRDGKRRFGWRARSDFATVLAALREGSALPFAHDPAYTSPIVAQEREACMS